MDHSFYIILHTRNQFQLLAIIFQRSQDKIYSYFVQNFLEFFLIGSLLKQSLSYSLAYIMIVISFLSQTILFLLLCSSTVIIHCQYDQEQRKRQFKKRYLKLDDIINELFHWILVIYPVIYLYIAVLSFSSLSCNLLSLIPFKESETISLVLISLFNGQIQIYTMRNHSFNEINSLKRRSQVCYSLTIQQQWLLYFFTIIMKLQEIQLDFSDSIIFSNYPYRDPNQITSNDKYLHKILDFSSLDNLQITSQIEEQQLFFLLANISINFELELRKPDQISINYKDSQIPLQEQKCYSKDLKFRQANLDQKEGLHSPSLSIIKCIFKTAQSWLFRLNIYI
ncbi:unnamed protein product (macronuclear) [Paramecium tetraurelia]|uniref:Transmembrane protein n=1 Tax=Paramecium tetraurelia TaxID=5888 RepID=A0EAT5_PARTE|nr:uncharacterized protein GSPATT00025136001 [Paramecium tetraurelia]CAK92402.1 unnamed protein product [Paramecium tetraurelia]|eukprot:XP_001459799.1 hypothetical protein (macronuclear) [Paramecium tetraurelia strain d4-2]